jgi:hypothetical protein
MHAPKTHAHPATKNLTGSFRIAISFALMFRRQYRPLFQRPSWRKTRPISRKRSIWSKASDLRLNGDRRLTTTRPALGHSLSIALAKFG